MILYPEIQKRAQAEVDSILQNEGRIPNLHDRSSMPYLECVLQEVLRWAPVVPLALSHATAEDDVYNGFWIPKKTTVLTNLWAMVNDESIYPNPGLFDPERYMERSGDGTKVRRQRDPREIVFGFGRRRCAGQSVAEASIWIQMATVLATLDLSKAVDDKGRVIEPKRQYSTAVVR
jgi:cytochrome P450